MTLRKIAITLALSFTCVSYSHASPYIEPPENDPPEEDQCEYDEESVNVAVGEAIVAFREKLKDCLNKASTLEATKACGDIEE